jgi:hypothetical protein
LLGFGSGFACLGYTPPARFERATSVSQFRSLRSFVSPFHSEKESGIFEKKERSRRTHIFPENGMFGFFSVSTPKKHESKQILYITRSYVTFFIPPPLATGNVT